MRAPRRPAALAAAALVAVAGLATAPPASAEPAVDVGGTPIDGGGSTDRSDPTPLEAGLWAGTLAEEDSTGDVRHFSYTRTMADSTVRVAAVASSLTGESDSLELEVSPEGSDTACSTTSVGSVFPTDFALFGTAVAAGPSEPDARDEECLTAATLVISVGRYLTGEAEGDLPFALKIVEEAPVAGGSTSDLPRPEESPRFDPPGAGDPVEVPAGTTALEDAPVVDPGSTWTAEVAPGEQLLWRVRLGWGQGLGVSAIVPPQDTTADGLSESDVVAVELGVLSPMRAELDAPSDAEYSGSYDTEEVRLATGVAPVAYRGRFDGSAPSVPGDYWVTLAVEPSDDSDAPDVPVELTVEVTGDVTGEPSYAEVVTAPGGGEGPAGYDASTPFLVAADTFAADPSGNPVIAPDATDDAGSARRWWGAGVAVVSLLACAAGVRRLRSA